MVKRTVRHLARGRRGRGLHRASTAMLCAFLLGCSQQPRYSPDAPLQDRPEALATTEVEFAPPSRQLQADLAHYACDNCHAIDHRRLGPALAEVGAVYAGADTRELDRMARHITDGSAGNWGTFPMPPQPAVDDATAQSLATGIATLGR